MKIATSQERLNNLFDKDIRNDSAIADELGISKQTISAWRKGLRSPKKPMLIRLAEMYHVSIEWLMGFEEEKAEEDPFWKSAKPQTPEARAVSYGMDSLPQEQRELILNMVKAMFPETFKKGNDDDEA